MNDIIVKDYFSLQLAGLSEEEKDRIMFSYEKYFTHGEKKVIFHPDILRDTILEVLSTGEELNERINNKTNEIVEELAKRMKFLGVFVFDRWFVGLEKESCKDCPSYRWVIHKEGRNVCRLFFDIIERSCGEDKWCAKPLEECLRPMTIGACYILAKALNLPEPIVGKLDKLQYEQYCKEKDGLCK